jgi:hypothetical protein
MGLDQPKRGKINGGLKEESEHPPLITNPNSPSNTQNPHIRVLAEVRRSDQVKLPPKKTGQENAIKSIYFKAKSLLLCKNNRLKQTLSCV